MPTAARVTTRRRQQCLLTVADVSALREDLPSGKVKYELYEGRLAIMPPPGGEHSKSQARVVAILIAQGEQRGYGEAFSEVGVILRVNPDTLVGPDAAFITNASLPAKYSKEGYLLTIPELVVEVRSKNDTKLEIQDKIADYHKAGVRIVWLLEPAKKTVTIYPRVGKPRTLGAHATLTANSVIPGFRVTVGELFGK